MLDAILLTKLANDAGFELEFGQEGSWAGFGIPGRTLRAWVQGSDHLIVVALSRGDVVAEIGSGGDWNGPLPAGAGGALAVDSPQAFLRTLQRARTLDRTLPYALLHEYMAAVSSIDSTEAVATVKQRRGQDIFRKGLMDYWQGRCAITGLAVPELLRASHAKPWKDSTDAERLDVHNGLLLAAHLDAAFDQGLITVDADGSVRCSPALDSQARGVLGLSEVGARISALAAGHAPYLAWHRDQVFRS
jgi:hypothetical protein